jgi:type IV pilus assembly protein PilQ
MMFADKFQRLAARLLVWCGLGLSGVALAQTSNSIEAISASTQGGQVVVRVDFAQPLTAAPSGFTVQQPARIALDFPGVGSNVSRGPIEINQGSVRSANVAQAGDRARVVLNLREATPYKTQIQGKTLLVVLDAPSGGGTQQVAASTGGITFAPASNVPQAALKDLDFRRGGDGSGRVIVDLPNSQVGVDIRQQGQQLVVEFLRASLPEGLRRRMDVTDFGTPVRIISATQNGDRVRLTIEPTGQYEHSAYQSETQFVLEVRPLRVDPNALSRGPNYRGEKLSLNFQNIDVRSLLQVIADFTNFNVVTSDTVTGSVTLRLKDVPWDQALDIILQAKGLGMKKQGNVLWIAPKDEIATKEKLELEARAQIADLEPTRTQGFQLNYTKADDVARGLIGTTVGNNTTRILSKRGSVISEARTNQLFVTDIPAKLEEIASLIAKIDVPARQVMIEARIIEADDKFGKELGAKLGFADLRTLRGGTTGASLGSGTTSRIGITGNYLGIGEQTGQATVTGESYIPNTYFVNLPANSLNGYSPGSLALSLFSAAANRFLNLELSALESDGRGKIVSSPRVVTADQAKALIEQGTELPYQSATSSGATAVQFRKANLRLEVTPQITPEGSIILDVDINKDSVGIQTTAGFAIDTKHVKTTVLVENGGTVVIGGIFQQTEREQVTKVPVFGDVPVVGNLFKQRARSSDKTELLVFLTPRVISDRAMGR